MDTLAGLLSYRPDLADRLAILFEDSAYTYADLEALSTRVAHALVGQGIKPRDVVCQVAGSHPEQIINMFGILKCGATYAPLSPSLTERELAAQLSDCRPSVVIADDGVIARKVYLAGAELQGFQVRQVRELSAHARELPRSPIRIPINPNDLAVLCYTSGTTGRSKGVQLSHRNVLTNARQVLQRTGARTDDRLLVMMPIFHVNGFCNQVVLPFLAKASIAMLPRFIPEEVWPSVVRYKPTYFTAVPTMLHRLLDGPDPPPEMFPTSLRFVRTGAAPLPVTVQRRFEARFEVPVIASYGLSEATCTLTMNPPTREGRKLGSVGTVLDGLEVKILGSDEKEQAMDQVGEVVARGDTLMVGYLGLPEVTAEAIPDGWLRTGDLGYFDDEGYLFLTDRKDDMIKRGGEKVSAREVEEVLYEHPMVVEAAVVGATDIAYGEVVIAFVVLRSEVTSPANVVEELTAHCRLQLAKFKVPARIEVWKELPKNTVGKVAKKELRERSLQIVP